jgi:hypothetical protein
VGYLAERRKARLEHPVLRDQDEIEAMAETYLALHWRLREFGLRQGPMDFAHYASTCNWGPLRVVDLEILDGDLAIDGVRLDQVEYRRYRQALSITQERHQAFNWLLGSEPVYSDVTTDT